MQAKPSPVDGGIGVDAIEVASQALLRQMLDDIREADDLIVAHFNQNSRVALADARDRLRLLAQSMAALDALSPEGWHEPVKTWPANTRVTISVEEADQ